MKRDIFKRVEKETDVNDKGFTLIEVIVAGGIISIGMLALTPLLISSYRIDTQTSYRVRAQYGVAQRLDSLIAQDDLACGVAIPDDFIDAQTGQVYAAVPVVPIVIRRTSTVGAAGVGCLTANLCQITVTSTYTDQGGAKTVTASSCKGR